MNFKPIETRYKGYRFRSRLEARWAVFFDAVGIEYEYEKEGYNLGKCGYYLPDFWVPRNECYIEIKGKYPTKEELLKLSELHTLVKTPCLLFYGDPCNNNGFAYFNETKDAKIEFQYSEDVNFVSRGCAVLIDMHMGFTGDSSSNIVNGESIPLNYYVIHGCMAYRGINQQDKLLQYGIREARAARFEHGDSPEIKKFDPYEWSIGM